MDSDSRCHSENSIFPLTEHERGACDAALHLSQHTKIELLPNVHINEAMELSGFHFEAAGCDTANVMPHRFGEIPLASPSTRYPEVSKIG